MKKHIKYERREELSITRDFVLSNQKDRDAVTGEVEDYGEARIQF